MEVFLKIMGILFIVQLLLWGLVLIYRNRDSEDYVNPWSDWDQEDEEKEGDLSS